MLELNIKVILHLLKVSRSIRVRATTNHHGYQHAENETVHHELELIHLILLWPYRRAHNEPGTVQRTRSISLIRFIAPSTYLLISKLYRGLRIPPAGVREVDLHTAGILGPYKHLTGHRCPGRLRAGR
jgi:hypothetical protein